MSEPADRYDDVAIVMITMDEEGSIRQVAQDLRRDVPGASITIVDSSKDRTPEIAAEENVEVVRQFPPKGYGPAMVRALTHPDRPVVVTLDCDGTYPTSAIPGLVETIRSGHDIAGTTRLAGGRPAAMPWSNYIGNRLFNIVSSLLFLRRIRDVHSGMRAYRWTTIHSFNWLAEPPALPVELLLLPIRAGLRVQEVPIPYAERIGQTTLQRLSSTVWTFRRILRSRTVPLADVRVPVAATPARPTVPVGRD
jgi:glycosyltransferase involved in cell wall biosynthesis